MNPPGVFDSILIVALLLLISAAFAIAAGLLGRVRG